MHLLEDVQAWDPFPPTRHFDDTADRHDAGRAVAVSAAGLALTGLVELAMAVLSGSVGLLGDALHNLSDVSTSLVVFVGFRVSKRPATPSHPYGYERAEDLAGLGIAFVVWASAALAAIVSVHKLTEHGHTSHLGLGIAAAAVGVGGNQIVARYKGQVGHRIQSATLVADAQHSWLDALSSAGALLGLVGVAAGLPWADGVAGLVVTAFIAHVGWEVSSGLVVRLLDGVDPRILGAAEAAALAVPGVAHVHVRARWMGRSLLVEVEGFVPAGMSIAGAESLGRQVEHAVAGAVPASRAVVWSPRAMPSAPGMAPPVDTIPS
jgi:cation diffusion facilitator family transporter